MMLHKIFLCFFALGCFFIESRAQKTEDVVYLKNGSVIHGKIIKQDSASDILHLKNGNVALIKNPNPTNEGVVKIQTYNRDVWVFQNDEVLEIRNELKPGKKSQLEIKQKGYFSIVNTSLLIGSENYYSRVSLSITNQHEYQFNSGLAVGGGVGIEWINSTFIPLFMDVSYFPIKKWKTPFISVQGGYSFPFSKGVNGPGIEGYYYGSYTGGPLFNASIGMRRYINSNSALLLSVGYRYQEMHYTSNNWWGGISETDYYINRLCLKMGFLFN